MWMRNSPNCSQIRVFQNLQSAPKRLEICINCLILPSEVHIAVLRGMCRNVLNRCIDLIRVTRIVVVQDRGREVLDLVESDGEVDILLARGRQDDRDPIMLRGGVIAVQGKNSLHFFIPEILQDFCIFSFLSKIYLEVFSTGIG